MSKYPIIYLVIIFLLIGCSTAPRRQLTQDEIKYLQIKNHCEDLAELAKYDVKRRQKMDKSLGGFYKGVMNAQEQTLAYETTYKECMRKRGYQH